jgi:hypothetical protein
MVIQPQMAHQVYFGEDELSRENVSRYIFENTGFITAFKRNDTTKEQEEKIKCIDPAKSKREMEMEKMGFRFYDDHRSQKVIDSPSNYNSL